MLKILSDVIYEASQSIAEDERSIANKLAREGKVSCQSLKLEIWLTVPKRESEPEEISKEAAESQKDPTLPVSISLGPLSVHPPEKHGLLISVRRTGKEPRQRAFQGCQD